MASNTYDTTNTGSAVSTKEQKMEGASIISPEQNPLSASLDKIRLHSNSQSWFLDDYSSPRIDAVAEGTNPSSYEDAFENIAEVFNYTHELERTGQITGDYELTDQYAYSAPLAAAKKKKTIELNRDVEKLCFSENTRQVGSKNGSARQTEGLSGMLTTGSSVFADAPDYVIPAAQVKDATAPTEKTFNAVFKSMLDESGDMQDVITYADSGWMNTFTENVLRVQSSDNENLRINITGNDYNVPLRLKVYDGINGLSKFVLTNSKCSRDTTNLDTALIINRKYCKLGHFGPNLSINDEPYRHGTREFSIRTKVMPIVTNPKACANWRSIA